MSIRLRLLLILLLLWGSIDAQCDSTLRPVIFIHGFLASGDTWSNAVNHFRQAGYCPDRLRVFDWNSVGGSNRRTDSLLDLLVDQVLAKTGTTQVDLVGHSAGGGIGRSYLKDSLRARKVAHYVHIGSRKWEGQYAWFSNDRCLNIYSAGDRVAGAAGGPVTGAKNLFLTDEDHYQVATGTKSQDTMLHFFTGRSISVSPTMRNSAVALSGRAVTLGDNLPMAGARIKIYSLRKKDGRRRHSDPEIITTADAQGNWGPLQMNTGSPYEFELIPVDSTARTISYFFSEFQRPDPVLYLRGFPQGSMVKALLGQIPTKNEQSALVVYSAASAMIGGRDSVTVNGIPVCSTTLTPAAKIAITSFIYEDGDGLSSGKSIRQFGATPFIAGVDLLLQAGERKTLHLYYNGRQLSIPARPSSERVLLAVFR